MASLIKLRKKIDKIDHKILKLLNKRANTVLKIGKIKQRNNSTIHDPAREAEILKNLIHQNNGPLTEEQIKEIFGKIIFISRSMIT